MRARHRSLGPVVVSLFIMAILAGCQTFNVQSDWDSNREHAQTRHYFFKAPPKVENANPFADNTLLRNRVQAAIEQKLAALGLVASPDIESADVLVTFEVLLEERLKVNSVTSGGGLGRGWRRGVGFNSSYSNSSVRAVQESTLVIDFLDPESEDLVWRGWGSDVLGNRDRRASQERLQRGVDAILGQFPPDQTGD